MREKNSSSRRKSSAITCMTRSLKPPANNENKSAWIDLGSRYEKEFVNDNERGGERGLRGIAVLHDRIIVSDSAGFIELDKNTYEIKRTFQDSDYFKSIHEIAF